MKTRPLLAIAVLFGGASAHAGPEGATSITVEAGVGAQADWSLVELGATVAPGEEFIVEASDDLVTWELISPALASAEGALAWEVAECPGFTHRFYRIVPAPPGLSSIVPQGRLARPTADGPFVYTTASGWTVTINPTGIVIVDGNDDLRYDLWGSIHESIGLKHVKDLLTGRRTLLLPGDVKITVALNNWEEAEFSGGGDYMRTVSIYEGDETHRIDMSTFSLVISGAIAQHGEADEHDGETARLSVTDQGLLFENIYEQGLDNPHDPCASAPSEMILETVPLALQHAAPSNQIQDYYDDLRMGHT